MKLYIEQPEDFNFSECLRFLGRSREECLHYSLPGSVRKLLKADGKSILTELGEENGKLSVDILHGEASPGVRNTLTAYITEWLDLERDLGPFYALAAEDPVLASLGKEYHGLRLIGIPNLFEALTWAITGQQINLAFAYTLKKRFTEAFGETLLFEGKPYYHYPSPEVISNLYPDAVSGLRFTRQKARFIVEAAIAIQERRISAESLKAMPAEEARNELMKLKGVGSWTASYVLMKSLGHMTAFPAEDVGLHNAVRILQGMERKPTVKEMHALSEKWKGWEAYAAFYLWRSLLKNEVGKK